MDTTAAKSQAQSMRSSIVSFQMTPDCAAALLQWFPTTLERRTESVYQGSHQQERNGMVVVVVVESHREGGTVELQETGTPRSIELVPIAGPENWHE